MCLHATDPKSCPKSLPFSNPSRCFSSTKMKTLRYFTLPWWQQLHLMFNIHFINRGFILDMYFVFHEKFAIVVNQEWIVVELMHSNSYVLVLGHIWVKFPPTSMQFFCQCILRLIFWSLQKVRKFDFGFLPPVKFIHPTYTT